ncbi:MAG TPA: NAD(+)/NADH kinase [Pirellulaceae bacterium]|nr:NAD(+)/NADH kinase [Pirellulaceae bacterium]
MKRRPRAILLGSGQRARVMEAAEELRPHIKATLDLVAEDFTFEQDLSSFDADLVIVLGGDGSILQAARQMGERQIPVVGVNLGRLGFLADIQPGDFVGHLTELQKGEYRVLEHLMLSAEVFREGKRLAASIGLNELAVLGGPPYRIVNIDLYIDEEFATTYRCDGLIVSTPVGSTAHSLSAGGPILQKEVQAFVISPISPHTLTVRPVVDTADRMFELRVRDPNPSTAAVVDGNLLTTLLPEDCIRVTRSRSTFRMVQLPGRSYYRTLREKLGWGGVIEGSVGPIGG